MSDVRPHELKSDGHWTADTYGNADLRAQVHNMALRLSGHRCCIAKTSAKEGDGYVSHLYCQNRIRGIKCPLEGIPGEKPYVLSTSCVEVVAPSDVPGEKEATHSS